MFDPQDTKNRLKDSVRGLAVMFPPERVALLKECWEQANGPANDLYIAKILDQNPRNLSPKSRATQIH